MKKEKKKNKTERKKEQSCYDAAWRKSEKAGVQVKRRQNGKDRGQGEGREGRERSSSDRRRDGGVQEQRLLLMSRVTQPKAP